jgi:predicted acyl esterase
LWITSDSLDADFTAKQIDVHPSNQDYLERFAMNLSEGALQVHHRNCWERRAAMIPGEVYALTIELFPIGNLFSCGHRLHLDLSSSNFPHFDVPKVKRITRASRKPYLRRFAALLPHRAADHPVGRSSRSWGSVSV